MLKELKKLLNNDKVPFSEKDRSILISLQNDFGILEFKMLEDDDNVLGLQGYPWHTHGEILKEIGKQESEAQAICDFIKSIFNNKLYLVELLKDGRTIDKYIEEDIESAYKYLEKGEQIIVHNKSH